MFPKKIPGEAGFELVLVLPIHPVNLPFQPLGGDKPMQVP